MSDKKNEFGNKQDIPGGLDSVFSAYKPVVENLDFQLGCYQKTIEKQKTHIENLLDSKSYKLGKILSEATKSLSAFLNTPQKIWELYKSVPQAKSTFAKSKKQGANFYWSFMKNSVDFAEHEPFKSQENKTLPIACILDTFSLSGFSPTADMIPLPLKNWQQAMQEKKPLLLFVESAFQGNDGQWRSVITEYASEKGQPLRDVLDYCKKHDIPTAFWNKEDPPNYEKFLPCAKDFDFVFTTDENCVEKYKKDCGHGNVWSLPFAAQPFLHNPNGAKEEGKYPVCFAGSWYTNKHDGRRKSLPMLLDPAMNFGLHIFDRYYYKPYPNHRFPEKYKYFIAGSLNYQQVLTAYRRYKAFLNTNTVSNSETMFSRRVFEILACGTPVISNESLGITQMLGEVVKTTKSAQQTKEHLTDIVFDKAYRRRLGHLGYRLVHTHHTYEKRMQKILSHVGIETKETVQPSISVIAVLDQLKDLENCLTNFTRQDYKPVNFIMVLNEEFKNNSQVEQAGQKISNLRLVYSKDQDSYQDRLALGANFVEKGYLAIFSSHDIYGDHYLSDLKLAISYSDADICGKCGHFALKPDQEKLCWREKGFEHKETKKLQGQTLLMKTEVFLENFAKQNTCADFLSACRDKGLMIYASDPYNFIESPVSKENASWYFMEHTNEGVFDDAYTDKQSVMF